MTAETYVEDPADFPNCVLRTDDEPDFSKEEEEGMAAYFAELDKEEAADLRKSIRMVLSDRMKSCDEDLPRLARWFYTVKFILCVLGDRYRLHDEKNRYPDTYEVAMPQYDRGGYGWSATIVYVGVGVFTQWFYSMEFDGDSSM